MTTPRQKAAKGEQSFDLDQARAIRRDREGAEFHFTFGGEDYTCPPIKEWSLDTMDLIQTGEMKKAMQDVLGDQYGAFAKNAPSVGDVEALIVGAGKFAGVGDSLGE